jgi:hypothetical protein
LCVHFVGFSSGFCGLVLMRVCLSTVHTLKPTDRFVKRKDGNIFWAFQPVFMRFGGFPGGDR